MVPYGGILFWATPLGNPIAFPPSPPFVVSNNGPALVHFPLPIQVPLNLFPFIHFNINWMNDFTIDINNPNLTFKYICQPPALPVLFQHLRLISQIQTVLITG
jgi:hypothetical protein